MIYDNVSSREKIPRSKLVLFSLFLVMGRKNELRYNPAMTNVAIRPMIREDIPIIANWLVLVPLWQRYRVSASTAQTQFEEGLRQQDIMLVSDTGPETRACGFTWCLPRGAFGLSAYLRLIGVRQEQAGLGIGSTLLAETERLAAAYSRDLFLLVSDFNVDAQRFYRRHGYEHIGQIPGYVLPDVTELIFRKRF
jgi:ribosomal protein S18 acetylase RimI-like enzyme